MTTPTKTPPGADPKQLERTGTVREIGSQAVWSLSSCKPGQPQTPWPNGTYTHSWLASFFHLFVVWPIIRFWSGSAERRQPGDLLAVRWISTSFSQHTISVLWFKRVFKERIQVTTKFTFVLFRLRRRTTVKMLCIYADYKSDESYTPSKISVRVGNNFHNLQEIRVQTLWYLSHKC